MTHKELFMKGRPWFGAAVGLALVLWASIDPSVWVAVLFGGIPLGVAVVAMGVSCYAGGRADGIDTVMSDMYGPDWKTAVIEGGD